MPVYKKKLTGLQWGRELTLAEMWPGTDTCPPPAPASMGPRADARGNPYNRYGSVADLKLQWGRELTLAEIVWGPDAYGVIFGLQWGRELTLAEMRRGNVFFAANSGFNGAAS